jgi:hypothetical protein
MTRRTWVLVTIAVVLGAIYTYNFTDLINTPRIQISKADRPIQYRRVTRDMYPVTFTLEGRYALTSVRVVPVAALATNKHPKPLWHLISKSNSIPIKGFIYGQTIRGLQPFSDDTRAHMLEPGITYRLYVEAGRAKGEIDFQARLPRE